MLGTITSQHLADESSVYCLSETNGTAVAQPAAAAMARGGSVLIKLILSPFCCSRPLVFCSRRRRRRRPARFRLDVNVARFISRRRKPRSLSFSLALFLPAAILY